MTASVTHTFVSPVADNADPEIVGPDEWNAAHTIAGEALSRVNDTNVTLTLGGTPTTALLEATSLTLGWTGALSRARGGFGTDVSATTGIPLLSVGSLSTITPGTGVATALAVNVGSAGAFVTFDGALGTPSSGTLTNCTGFPVASLSGLGAGVATFLATPSSANLASAVTDETGSGALVFATTPTLVTPILGTPTSGTLTNCTGLPVSGISGLGTGVATFLATPSSANLATAITDETGSGALVFGTSPGFTTAANPVSNDGASLGISGTAWSDLFLASGGVINWGAGNVTLTHATGQTSLTGRVLFTGTPVYDLSANVEAHMFAITLGTSGTTTVAANKVLNYIHLGNADGTDPTLSLGAGALVSGFAIDATADSASNATSNLYGSILHVVNAGAGNARGIHARGAGSGTSTGTVNAVNAEVAPVSTMSFASALQVSLTSSGVDDLTTAIYMVSTADRWNFGLYCVDEINQALVHWTVSAGSAASARFLRLYSAAAAEIYYVDKTGVSHATGSNPITDDGAALGTTSFKWSDLFLASGSVINFNSGDVTVTHAANLLTVAGGDLATSGVHLLADGTAAAPSLAFTNDTDCGIARLGANVWCFSTAGAEVGRITSGGVLSWGTTAGGASGEIACFQGFIKVGDGNNTNPTFLLGNTGSGQAIIGGLTNHDVVHRSNNTDRLTLTAGGNFVCSAGALATTATDGFIYVPTCAGTPTGTPTGYTGAAPIVVNTTNNKLYFYSGGAWRDAGP